MRYVREVEESDYEVGMTARLPNLVSTGQGFDIAGSNVFDLRAVFGTKPGKGVSRPRTFKVDPGGESPR